MRPALRLAMLPAALVLVMTPRPAAASDPSSIYVVPTRVDILPNEDASTHVVLAGSFFFLNSATGFSYDEPKCGYMVFQCPPKWWFMCRMQWQDIRKYIGGTMCAGFGGLNMISTATVRSSPDGPPDLWDLGMGITPGAYVDGKCAKARALNCALPAPSDAGSDPRPPADAGVVIDAPVAAPDAATQTTPDAAVSPLVDTGSPPPAVADAAVPGGDAAPAPALAASDGCALGGRGWAGPWPVGAALLLALALGRRARRR